MQRDSFDVGRRFMVESIYNESCLFPTRQINRPNITIEERTKDVTWLKLNVSLFRSDEQDGGRIRRPGRLNIVIVAAGQSAFVSRSQDVDAETPDTCFFQAESKLLAVWRPCGILFVKNLTSGNERRQ